MSAQSIVIKGGICDLRDRVDEYLDCSGVQFLNIEKYDLGEKFDYKKLNTVILLRNAAERCDEISGSKLYESLERIMNLYYKK